jgi:hypothetical protein
MVEAVRVNQDRRRADDWIMGHADVAGADASVVARIDELLEPRTRTSLAWGFARIAAEVSGRRSLARTPITVDARRLANHVDDLNLLARKLDDLASPVSPRGVALANRLLTDGTGPLYGSRRSCELATALHQTIDSLDVD